MEGDPRNYLFIQYAEYLERYKPYGEGNSVVLINDENKDILIKELDQLL